MVSNEQLKKMAFLVPRPDLRPTAFLNHWRRVHGRIVAHAPGYARFRRRYLQNHVLDTGPVGRALPYAGIAEFWLPHGVPNEEDFSSSTTYRDHIRVDEETFIDMQATVSMTAVEQVARPGGGTTKLIIVDRRAGETAAGGFRDAVATRLVETVLGTTDFGMLLRGWVINHVLDGSFHLPGARPIKGIRIDCIQELWFDSPTDARLAFESAGYVGKIRPLEERLFWPEDRYSLFAEEVIFFDAGHPVQ